MLSPTKTLFGFALCLGTAACGSDAPMNIGDIGVTGEKLSDYAGTWEGYAEAHEFEDGSDRVQLVLNANGQGTVQIGENVSRTPPKMVPAQPNFPFTPVTIGSNTFNEFLPFDSRPAPGFSYPITHAEVETHRINFGTSLFYPYADWCSGFTPFEFTVKYDGTPEETKYDCHQNSIDRMDEFELAWHDANDCYADGVRIECVDIYCSTVCECDRDNCFMREISRPRIRLDGDLNALGNELVGTLVIPYERLTVRLVRQP